MLRSHRWLAALALFFAVHQTASAHFLWVVVKTEGTAPAAHVYFGEAAEPDDPALLDRFANLEAWSVPGGRAEPQKLSFQKKEDLLHADLSPAAASSPVVLRHKYGVITRGGETFLL